MISEKNTVEFVVSTPQCINLIFNQIAVFLYLIENKLENSNLNLHYSREYIFIRYGFFLFLTGEIRHVVLACMTFMSPLHLPDVKSIFSSLFPSHSTILTI
jgi:hypothetical protein